MDYFFIFLAITGAIFWLCVALAALCHLATVMMGGDEDSTNQQGDL